jgi:D-glycero-D-manno-heptose 1,7-bisphosphate phosphatase
LSAVRLVILDRDGVINEDSDAYVKSPAEWRAIAGSLEAIARLNHAGCRVVVATNQSGIARGLFGMEQLNAIHQRLHGELARLGGQLDGIYFCPHGPEDGCACRKPRPGLLHEIGARHGADLAGVPAIGDSLRDIEAARAVGARPILVRTGKGRSTEGTMPKSWGVACFDDLAAAVECLVAEHAR